MRNVLSVTCGLLLSLILVTALQAQVGQRNQPPRPAPGEPADPRSAFGGQLDGVPARHTLQPRELQDHPLEEREQRKYDLTITGLEKRAAAMAQNPTLELASTFRLASTHLRNRQEQAARDGFEEAWQMVVEMYKDPRTMGAATGQVRAHLRELQTVARTDPELALTLMSELDPAHQEAFEAIEQERARSQLAQPLAQTWSQLMMAGPLDKESLHKAAAWLLLFPQMALADRPLPPDQQGAYQSQLTQVNVLITQQLQQLAALQFDRQRQLQGGPPDRAGDMAIEQRTALLDAKRGPLTRFMEADVHLQFGQFRNGLDATGAGWQELMEFYRNNPRTVTPADTELHFQTLSRLAETNPIQALVIMAEIDPLYRNMLAVDRFFGVRLADLWMSMADDLPLNPPMLTKAADWLEHVSKQHKDMETRYAGALQRIKNDLEADSQPADGQDPREPAAPPEADEREEARPNTPRGIPIPRSIDRTRPMREN